MHLPSFWHGRASHNVVKTIGLPVVGSVGAGVSSEGDGVGAGAGVCDIVVDDAGVGDIVVDDAGVGAGVERVVKHDVKRPISPYA